MVMLVVGGSGSGKSAWAEDLACALHVREEGPLLYLAAMDPAGEEGRRRVERHRALRAGKGFVTLERPLGPAPGELPPGSTLLLEDLENLLKGIMRDCPPDSVGLVDTMGCALPQTIAYMVRWMKRLTGGLPIEVHAHNDFGMAVACELAGAAAGAEVLHACVNGMGERTGNAALEELVLAMNILLEMDTPYRLDKLEALCSTVEELSGIPCAPNKPFVGKRNYTRESGIGVNLVTEKPLAMFATDPRIFGREADIALGKKSGKASIQYYLDQLGLEASDEQVAEMLAEVKALGIRKKGLVTLEEFREIAGSCR